ncbi:MAG: lipopolysaccharide heptosyltransferase family protein [Cytophagales bacterium]|nr:MAG: lipopolysaccharide heptosyltransferase family protein [Cytophagales bacterium]
MEINLEKTPTFIISRTDSIGDVVLTIPMAGILKKHYPNSSVIFIGNNYTYPVLLLSEHVDLVIKKEDLLSNILNLKDLNAAVIFHVSPDVEIAKLAQKSKIKYRIGTSHRWFHWLYCNIQVSFSRKKSLLHESILNLKLLKPLIKDVEKIELKDIQNYYGFKVKKRNNNSEKIKIIFHPKSKGSAREWKLSYFHDLIKLLPKDKFEIYITGTELEYQKIQNECSQIFDYEHVINMCGKFTLNEFVAFIQQSDVLLACSTGPLHIAAACEIHAIGIYASAQNMHPNRWAAQGKNTKIFFTDKICFECNNSTECACINQILPNKIAEFIKRIPNSL